MVSSQISRRALLYVSGITLVGIAGCTTSSTDRSPNGEVSNPEPSATPTATATERNYEHTVTMPETVRVRNPEGLPAIVSTSYAPERDMLHHSGERENAPGWDHETWFVTTPEEREALEFPEDTTSGVDDAKRFISNTDLPKETLAVQQYQNVDCSTVELTTIKWDSDERFPEGAYAIRMEFEDTENEGDCADHSDSHTTHPDAKEVHAIIARIPVDIQNVTATTTLM